MHRCEGCAEKADFVAMCEANKDAPLKPKEEPPANRPKEDPGKKEDIDDILGKMKGIPGMEGIKMFTVRGRSARRAAQLESATRSSARAPSLDEPAR